MNTILPKAGPRRYVLRCRCRGQRLLLPGLRQQMRPCAAHGQHPLRCPAGALLRRGRGFRRLPAAQPAGSGQSDGFSPGSMFGALLCGIVFHKTNKLLPTLVGEVFGTSILGGLCAYPVAILLMGKSAGDIAFYAYIVPFLVSTAGGAIIAGALLAALFPRRRTPRHAGQPELIRRRSHVSEPLCQRPGQKPACP